ncbi:predicted protein [Chaetomium globosum CBS 148.51]|uniref:Uncharacterized protein n=1 Tax=Chaetomium globosum (strain ATCC 6205 / CBS 148.51 / DSM 1962 / NBRC 6347 / NRRL 1970) TaxID=306901 RepID=Q2H5K0_CHAGB|nr:uncharacterized protein CHGG_06065 [Chaetomium globosum CBS 148.51]EAQ89446.1 predicted protein [Chaetomium globosum CBS 148.51]
METKSRAARSSQKGHNTKSTMRDTKSAILITATSIVIKPRFSRREKMPKAGMVYHFKNTLMNRSRSEIGIVTAIKAGTGARQITTRLLDDTFSQIFREATNLIQASKENCQISHFEDNPIEVISSIRRLPALQHIWMRRNLKFLAGIFLLLRAARQNWHRNPRDPYSISKHCKTAQAIDKFLAVDALD